MIGLGRQYRVARNCVRTLTPAPQVFLYPLLTTLFALGYPLALFAYPAVGDGYSPTLLTAGFVLYFLLVPLSYALFMVAYCYELNELFEGREPAIGSGLSVAVDRFRLVTVAALVFGTGGMAVRYLGSFGRLGAVFGRLSSFGLEIVSTFAFPVVALSTEDQSFGDAVDDLATAVRSAFGAATFATVGVRALGLAITSAGFLAAAGLLAAWFYRGVDIAVGPLGPLTLPVVLVAGGVITAIVVVFVVSGAVQTALYRYAVDGELPAGLGVGIDDFVTDPAADDDDIRSLEAGASSWLALGRQQAGTAITSLRLWGVAVPMAIATGLVAFFASPIYTAVLESAVSTVEESDANVAAIAEAEELEALELVLGPDPTREDILTGLEAMLASGDVLGVGVLSTLILSLGPIVGLGITVPAILRRRRDGAYAELLEVGYTERDVVLGTFLGRLTAAALVIVLPALAIAAAVWYRHAPVGSPYLVATGFAVACVGIFVACGVLVGTTAKGWKSAVLGSLGVLLVPYALSGNPLGVTSSPGREGALQAVLAPPWAGLPPVLTRFNLYNVVFDGMHLYALSAVVESVPRLSRVALNPILASERPPRDALAELPFYLQQWFVYAVVAVWIAVPLVAATKWFKAEL